MDRGGRAGHRREELGVPDPQVGDGIPSLCAMQALLRPQTLFLSLALLTPTVAWAQDPPAPAPTPEASQDESPIPADGSEPVTLPSGLVYSVLRPAAEGARKPGWGANLEVHYTAEMNNIKHGIRELHHASLSPPASAGTLKNIFIRQLKTC